MTAPEEELRLGFLIHDVSRLRRTLFDKWLSPLGITRSQWWVLSFLSRNDGMPQTELAIELDVGKVALGALIDRLEAAGFVSRNLDTADRRLKRVVLTKRSKVLLEAIHEKNVAFNKRILVGITSQKMAVAAEVLRDMKHNLLAASREFEIVEPRPAGKTPSKRPSSSSATASQPERRLRTAAGNRR